MEEVKTSGRENIEGIITIAQLHYLGHNMISKVAPSQLNFCEMCSPSHY